MIRILSFLIVMIFAAAGLAQDPAPVAGQAPPAVLDSLDISVDQDPRIEWLLKAHQKILSRQQGIPGFRIQVYVESGNQSRVRIQNKKFEFDELFPQIPSYIVYDAPYFKLRVGDFRTRLEARKVSEQIASEYGDAFIVVDEINPPEIELQQQQQPQDQL